jgi:radical SAM family RiPP maturation amino acid epimerase
MAKIDSLHPEMAELLRKLRAVPAQFATVKRFMQRMRMEPDFAANYDLSPAALPVRYGEMLIGADELAAYQEFLLLQLSYRELYRRLGAARHPIMRAWRERQILRTRWELGESHLQSLVHAPACVELSRGCTVKCWFCGIGAEPFLGHFRYDEENGALWRGTLEVLHELIGSGLAHAFLYWGTDPFDNPDYEKFVCDFHELLGMWPQTTTALPLRDVTRTHAFLRLSYERGGILNRFSVLSRSILSKIFQEFSPEELLHVQLLPLFSDELLPKAVAGAARARALRKHQDATDPALKKTESGGTIACVSGFLFNMAERRVRLISPCSASSRFPLGYMVFRDFHFDDVADLRNKLEETVATCMPLTVPSDMRMSFLPCLRVEYPAAGGFILRSAAHSMSVSGVYDCEDLARRVEAGRHSAAEIAAQRMLEKHIDPVETFQNLNYLFGQGVLSEETPPDGVGATSVPLRIRSQPAASHV